MEYLEVRLKFPLGNRERGPLRPKTPPFRCISSLSCYILQLLLKERRAECCFRGKTGRVYPKSPTPKHLGSTGLCLRSKTCLVVFPIPVLTGGSSSIAIPGILRRNSVPLFQRVGGEELIIPVPKAGIAQPCLLLWRREMAPIQGHIQQP